MNKWLKDAKSDTRVRKYIHPVRVVWHNNVEHCSQLYSKITELGCDQAVVNGRPGCTLKSKAAILFDFGREIYGGIQIICGNSSKCHPVRLQIRFGESVSEAMSSSESYHSIRDSVVFAPFLGTAEFGNSGFRFARIDVVDDGAEVEICAVRAVAIYHDFEYRGSFECSDDRLNRIWQTGAYTVHLCMQDYLWDGIKRDRLVWINDMFPESAVISSVFGNIDIVPRSLDLIRNATLLPKLMNYISSNSLWWILVHYHWFMYQGNLEYLREQKDYILALMEFMSAYIDGNNGEILPEVRFMDWASSDDKPAIHGGLQALMAMAFATGAKICNILREEQAGRKYGLIADRLGKHSVYTGCNLQANALQVLAGMSNAQDVNQGVFAKKPFDGISTVYGYYILQARAIAGDYQGCLDMIRGYWGGMLDLGATTFWEHFDIAWQQNGGRIDEIVPAGKVDIHASCGDHCYKGFRHSLCHGWASGPTAWLSQHVLGIEPVVPGFKEVTIKPNLGDLAFAKGSVPTPLGLITVTHERRADGAIMSKHDIPTGVKIV